MPYKKGQGKKERLSVTVDREIVMKLNKKFNNSRGEKSELVNRILADHIDDYLNRDFHPFTNYLKECMSNGNVGDKIEGPFDWQGGEFTIEVNAARKDIAPAKKDVPYGK
jgi:hypothetical protein